MRPQPSLLPAIHPTPPSPMGVQARSCDDNRTSHEGFGGHTPAPRLPDGWDLRPQRSSPNGTHFLQREHTGYFNVPMVVHEVLVFAVKFLALHLLFRDVEIGTDIVVRQPHLLAPRSIQVGDEVTADEPAVGGVLIRRIRPAGGIDQRQLTPHLERVVALLHEHDERVALVSAAPASHRDVLNKMRGANLVNLFPWPRIGQDIHHHIRAAGRGDVYPNPVHPHLPRPAPDVEFHQYSFGNVFMAVSISCSIPFHPANPAKYAAR